MQWRRFSATGVHFRGGIWPPPPYPHVLKPCRCFLNPVFFFLHPTGDEEAAQRGNRHCGGERRQSGSHQEPSRRARRTTTRDRGVIARRCGAGAVRRDGGRWRRCGSAPIKRGSSKTGQPQVSAVENRAGPFGHDFLFFFFFLFFSPYKKFFFPHKGSARS